VWLAGKIGMTAAKFSACVQGRRMLTADELTEIFVALRIDFGVLLHYYDEWGMEARTRE